MNNQEIWDRVQALDRLPRRRLLDLVVKQRGAVSWEIRPPSEWSRDELIAAIMRHEEGGEWEMGPASYAG